MIYMYSYIYKPNTHVVIAQTHTENYIAYIKCVVLYTFTYIYNI